MTPKLGEEINIRCSRLVNARMISYPPSSPIKLPSKSSCRKHLEYITSLRTHTANVLSCEADSYEVNKITTYNTNA